MAAVIIFILYRQIDFEKFQSLSFKIDYTLMVAAFTLYVGSSLIRAKRFNYLLDNGVKLIDMFKITSLYNLYTGLLPGGIGELSFVYLLRKKVEGSVPAAFSSVIITRIHDIFIMAVFLLISLLIVGNAEVTKAEYVMIFAVIIIMLFLIRYIDLIINTINKTLSLVIRHGSFLLNTIEHLSRVGRIMRVNRDKSLSLLFVSASYWVVNSFIVQLLFRSMGVNLGYFEAVLMTAITIFVSIIPFNTLGGFGYKEAGITLGLMFIMVDKNSAIFYSFLFHLLSLGFMFALATLGMLTDVKLTKVRELFKMADS